MPRQHQRGFTLLELLVVLALIGLVAGVSLPAAGRWLDAVRERGWRQELHASLTALPLAAFRQGRPTRLEAKDVRALVADMPADLAVELSAPLIYSARGLAEPAEVRLRDAQGRVSVWRIEAGTGRVIAP
ncbi:prepilin-type N-terminal cleavage/methylation domain-containing protein [Roseateles sp.]|uniref:prepilin-type N-terminal cleavage/methylation domain-containing protein n=1 Tax=Roseateles sp. TaxID=1971397 RepID=UPI0025FE1F89|nr:prepilin-type N-terminal cleavage/methylation domain-containing protein [Roseateles sp.]MBV8033811.1 prepilin-type N-terminal cleavage/methylation domain-containing protein [Roseateles sp.]